ncbi:uncharacterized protein LOC132190497 isoform X2 [Corylus avellana]|uniref:uncharacterized protein LOC132190497 isoform X2 n=1 Tax=Corylus avellana TaxID=13451 RepID=UPI00286B4681|nr:uncharacterized protein LOC132190497 isoform X2 [Corylus avellana]
MEDVVIDPMNLSPRGDDDQDRPSTGFINHLLCNLKRSINVSEVEDEDKAKGGGGGLISHLISNLVSPISPKVGKVEAFDGNGGLLKQGKTEDEGGGGGGVIENLVSRLPSPLQDDVAPTTDEASILIHSIIHD